MSNTPVFVFGMIRSGTTFLSKMLSSHEQIEVASDPYMQYFKSFRNDLALRKYNNYDKNTPIDDLFWNNCDYLYKKINDTQLTLNIPISNIDIDEIIGLIDKYCYRDSPKVRPYLNKIKADNYKSLLDHLLTAIKLAYGNENVNYYGFKTTFCEQFIRPIINSYPESKCICIVRDPRSIYASHINEHKNQYPILFLIRQWRKSIHYFLENNYNKKNILIIKFEDMVSDPRAIAGTISKFIGVSFDDKMVNLEKFTGRDGVSSWTNNSSFGSFNKNAYNKWESILKPEEVQLIEDLCESEIKCFGYKRVTDNDIFNVLSRNIREKSGYEWMKPYKCNYTINEREINKELIRYLFLSCGHASNYRKHLLISEELIKGISINK